MTTPQVVFANRSSRLLWMWCVAYTVATPRAVRQRRRAEMRSHLWESEHAGLASRSVLWAAVRGALDDVSWMARRGSIGLARAFGTPTPYVLLAAVMPIQAWIVSSFARHGVAQYFESVGGYGGPAMLLVAGVVWWLQRLRQP
jgi:hypothetical protein